MARTSSLDAVINVRVRSAEKTALRDDAATAGLTLSAYCRRRILGHPVVAQTDRSVIRELRRIGGLLKHVHVESGGAYNETTADALRALRKAIGDLASDRQKSRQPGSLCVESSAHRGTRGVHPRT